MKRSYKTQNGYFFYHQENGSVENLFNDNDALDIYTSNGFAVEVTKDYEGDNYHVVSYEPSPTRPMQHYETVGFNTLKEVLNYVNELEQEETCDFEEVK